MHRTTVYDYLRKEDSHGRRLPGRARRAGQVVRRVLLRRNIAIDAETAELAAAVQAALRADAPSRPPRRRRRAPPPPAPLCSDPAGAGFLAPATGR